jgi:hypothetical protein
VRRLHLESSAFPFKARTVIVWATITGVASVSVILILILVPDMIFATELFAGITGVVSIGILIAAIAAAIYTKPAYDDFRRQQAPYDVRVERFSLKDSYGKRLQAKMSLNLDDESAQNFLMLPETFAPPVFIVCPDTDILIKFYVEFVNHERDRQAELGFNLFVPSSWDLHVEQPEHGVARTTVPYELGGSTLDVKYTLAQRVSNPNGRIPFYADIRAGLSDMQSIFGKTWPMAFSCRIGTRGQSIRHEWSIEIANSTGES